MRFKPLLSLLGIGLLIGLGWLVYDRLHHELTDKEKRKRDVQAVPVEVAAIVQGPIALRRDFTGTLEARAEFVVSPKIDGRIVQLDVDIGDAVLRDQVVARLDDAEFRQSVAQAEADLSVARANLAEANSLLVIAERELTRIDKLQEKGVSSVSQRDVAKADQLAKQAHVQVTRAQVARAEAELEATRIRLGYTEVNAAWRAGNEQRVVAERFVDEGETVTANTPLLRIVELDPIVAVFYVTERDYAQLQVGQDVQLGTDAYAGEVFHGRIARIAPVFRQDARQARVEVSIDNPDLHLKPGMYARAAVVLEKIDNATIVPEQALASRDGGKGVFVLSADGKTVNWRPVQVGIQEGDRVQVKGEGLSGRVVTLGQQLLDEGSAILLPDGPGN
ncbi:MAG: efflux RND transporter periplasmic adaptor subunit [Chromatiales bacterium]|jgi:RND family efflux transporter MFP subunit